VRFIPMSALKGDNVVDRSEAHALVLRARAAAAPGDGAYRVRPQPHRHAPSPCSMCCGQNLDFRGFAGTLAIGHFCAREITSRCCRPESRAAWKSIVTLDGELDEAFAPQAITVYARTRNRRFARRHDRAPGLRAAHLLAGGGQHSPGCRNSRWWAGRT